MVLRQLRLQSSDPENRRGLLVERADELHARLNHLYIEQYPRVKSLLNTYFEEEKEQHAGSRLVLTIRSKIEEIKEELGINVLHKKRVKKKKKSRLRKQKEATSRLHSSKQIAIHATKQDIAKLARARKHCNQIKAQKTKMRRNSSSFKKLRRTVVLPHERVWQPPTKKPE